MALTPERIAELERLKAMMRPAATEAQRRAQAIWNAEQAAKAQVPGKANGGLAKFLEESKVKDRMYHATHGDFNSFRNNHRGIHFVTPSHEFADDFLTNSGQDDHEEGANIMPVHVHAKNPFDYENEKHVNALATKASLGKLGIDQIKKGDWSRIEDRTTLKAIKDLGHDAVYVNEGGVKNLGVFHPHQIKSAIGNRGTYDPTDPDITMAEGGNVKPSLAQMKLALNKQGMYSPLEKAAMAVPRTKGTHAEFMAETSKQPGFRKEEVADRKIPEADGKMTKDEFLAHLKKHSVPPLHEQVYKDDEDQQTQYGDYQLPGGQNYREMLLKTPRNGQSEVEQRRMMGFEADMRRGTVLTPEQQKVYEALKRKEHEPNYQSSHWQDDPNVLAHIRLSDRFVPGEHGEFIVETTRAGGRMTALSTGTKGTREQADAFAQKLRDEGKNAKVIQVGPGVDGKKLLHVEEIQSDWHQQGRKDGYGDTLKDGFKLSEQEPGFFHLNKDGMSTPIAFGSKEEVMNKARQQGAVKRGVPDAPFKKSWHELAMKHVLHHAAANGYDGVVITPGQHQADRYDLSKKIGSIAYDPQEKLLDAWDHDRRKVLRREITDESQLGDYIGKEAATKLLQAQPVMGKHLLEGQDLRVGGEGMKGFYDKIVPDYLNKLGKQYGTQVGKMDIDTPSDSRDLKHRDIGDQTEVHHFPINDEMRQSILKNGLPQYKSGGVIHKAEGGNVQPSLAQMKLALGSKGTPPNIKDVGINEAINLAPKVFMPPDRGEGGMPAPGGVATRSGMPIGGIDMSQMNPGQQLMPQPQQPPQAPQGAQPPQSGLQNGAQGPQGPTPPMGNMLSMTPQGQAMSAMGGAPAQGLAKGGQPSVDSMKAEMAAKDTSQDRRVTIKADGPGGVKGIVVPRHTLEGNAKSGAVGLNDMNEARAKVYGGDHRPPLTLNKIASEHKKTLANHFAKPIEEQHAAEKEALDRLRAAKHLGKDANTLDESEKLDTVRHETDEQGRTHVGFAAKGVAGHALYTSGSGKDTKYHVINTCPGQTEGCGGGKDAEGIVDTKKGTCFAPNAESQYPGAATRRAAHAQAKHDPAMTNDWILAHTGSLRNAARLADKKNQRLLFRPNVVDETDVSSRHAIRHLNEQRKAEGKPDIIANSYGKTNELHDPENGYHVTHSNVGPKVKKGQEIAENIGRDKARVRNTIMAADNKGDFKNEQGNKTPPKGSYMVTDVKRGSPMAKKMEEHITHAKYWTTGRPESELTHEERAEGPEGHFSGTGRKTSEDKAHYGHLTHEGLRYDYQRQHILHPRLVQVGNNKDGTKHMIPTDSRFKDEEFLPKNRFKTKNGKEAGHILMTTPTESTSNIGHETSFTHNVGPKHIEHAQNNNGEYEIDKPEDQVKAKGKEYSAPQSIKFYAEGGQVGGRHHGFAHDDFHAFPEQNVVAQRHLAMRRGEDEAQAKYDSKLSKGVKVHKNMDTMRLELTRK